MSELPVAEMLKLALVFALVVILEGCVPILIPWSMDSVATLDVELAH